MTNPHADLINRLSYGCRDIETGDPLTTGFTNTRVEDVQQAITALSAPITLAQAMTCPEVQGRITRMELINERQRWWQPEYPGQEKPVLRVWFRGEPETGLSGFDTKAERDEFHNGGDGPFMRRVTGNEYPQIPFNERKANAD